MRTQIKLDTIDKVKRFVNAVRIIDGDIDISNRQYVVDGKSIMGILSLDLSSPLDISIQNIDETEEKKAEDIIQPFLA